MPVKEQYAGFVSVWTQSTFGSSGNPSSTDILRPALFDVGTEIYKPNIRVNVWRQTAKRTIGQKSYYGTMEFEIDAIMVGQLQFIRALLEDRGTVGGVNTLEPPRATPAKSLGLLVGFEGGPWFDYRGVVVERIRWQFRTAAVGRMVVEWRAAQRNELPSQPGWPVALTVGKAVIRPKDIVIKIDDVTVNNIYEIGFEIQDAKVMAQYDSAGNATKLSRDGQCGLTGTLIQYWDPAGTDLADLMRSGGTFKLYVEALDADYGLGLKLTAPEVYVETGEPVPLGREDVVINASFRANLGGTGANTTTLELLV